VDVERQTAPLFDKMFTRELSHELAFMTFTVFAGHTNCFLVLIASSPRPVPAQC